MKFRYLGEKDNMQVFGYDFRDGATPDVTDENALKRLSGNSHFEVVDEDREWLEIAPNKKKPGRKPKAEVTE